jgi:predicted CXXCH cytochrome family protein
MNRVIKFAVALVFVSASSVSVAQMTGGSHDLSTGNVGGLGTNADLCRYCHTPHNSRSVAPLWDRSDSLETFTVYSSTTMADNVMPAPSGVSLGCLSCHDGVTAFDAVAGTTGTAGNDMTNDFPNSPANLSNDLSNDHPVGVNMAIAGIDNTQTAVPTFGGKVECASCHDVHVAGTSGYFLRVEDGSLCESCHTK